MIIAKCSGMWEQDVRVKAGMWRKAEEQQRSEGLHEATPLAKLVYMGGVQLAKATQMNQGWASGKNSVCIEIGGHRGVVEAKANRLGDGLDLSPECQIEQWDRVVHDQKADP